MNEITRLESDDLILRVFDTGLFAVGLKRSGHEWLPDPWQGVPCRLTIRTADGAQRVVDLGGAGSVKVDRESDGIGLSLTSSALGGIAVTAWLGLQHRVLSVVVREVLLPEGASLVSVEHPFRCFYLRWGIDDGYLALPSGEGCLIPTGPVKLGTTRFWHWEDLAHGAMSQRIERRPTMPFYGARRDGSGYTAILETTDDFAFCYLLNSDFQHAFDAEGRQSPYEPIACAWPQWLAQKGRLGYERRMRFEFADELDYVGMAKTYRREAIRRRHFVSLRDKALARPQVERLAGAPYLAYYAGYPHRPPGYPGFDYTYRQLTRVVGDLSGPLGLRRAFVHFWGAYSVQPPGCLPFDPAPGPVEDLAEAVARCRQAGFLFTLYNDISAQLEETDLWMPELMWKTADGRVRQGRRWSRTCSSQYVELLSRHMPEVVEKLGVEAAYVDCINSGCTEECYDPSHPLTRTEDREARTRLYEYVHSLGLIFGGEHAGWWNAAQLEYTNGVGDTARDLPLLRAFSVPLAHPERHCRSGPQAAVRRRPPQEAPCASPIEPGNGQPPCSSITSSIAAIRRMVSDRAVTTFW